MGQISVRSSYRRAERQRRAREQKRAKAARRALVRALADRPLTVSVVRVLLHWLGCLSRMQGIGP